MRLSFPLAGLLIAMVLTAAAAGATPRGVRITMHDGRVSIAASDVTLAEVLDEWTRVGGSIIINPDIAKGAPVTVDLVDVPESEALAVLLRSVGGYIAVERGPRSTNVSRFERILLMPARAMVAPSASGLATPPPATPPRLPAEFVNGVSRILGPNGQPVQDDQDGAPAFNPTPRPIGSYGDPPPQAVPPTSPTPAAGSRVPGVIAPAPVTPQQPPQR